MRTPSAFDLAAYAAAILLGVGLIALARWAGRRRGTRWDSLVALRVGDVLLTEVFGVFLIGYGIGSAIAIGSERPTPGPPGPPVGGGRFIGFRGFGAGDALPFTLAIAFALIDVLMRIHIGDLLLAGRASRNPLRSYLGWDARVVAAIPAGGFGEIALRDGAGNVVSVAATADVDIAAGAQVRVVATRDLNLVVAPLVTA